MEVLTAFFFIVMSHVAYGVDPYIRRNLATYCPSAGSKKEVRLGTQAAIFTLSARDLAHDLSCHLELEAPGPPANYGIHVYIQEMNFEGDEDGGGCRDYVQYSRDVLAFTTYNSPKFCGKRRLIDYRHGPADAHRGYDSRHQRLYVEERDSEMDVYIVMKSNRKNIAYSDPRNLTLVATVFRKRCKREGRFGGQEYTSCPKTDRRKGDLSNCIRSEYFCDGYVNCAWPDGDLATDEAYCKEGKFVGLSGKEGYDEYGDGVVSASNIPIIIIVVIVVIGISLVFFMALRHVYRGLKTPPATQQGGNESGQERSHRRRERERLSPSGGETASAPPLLPREQQGGLREVRQAGGGSVGGGLRAMPSAPPSYEEAVKIADRRSNVVEDSPAPPHPPPYSEADETSI